MKMNASAEPEKQTQYKPNFIRHSLGEGGTKPKQTQFPKSQKMNVTSILTKDYENETAFRLHPRRGKQTQSNPIFKNSG
jgi:hypothetical protein